MFRSAKSQTSSPNNILTAGLPGTYNPIISFSKVSRLNCFSPLAKVGQGNYVQMDDSMYVFANFGIKVPGEYRFF